MRKIIFLIAVQLLFSALAFAQVDVFGFAGARSSRNFDTGIVCITAPCPTAGLIESGPFFGAAVDFGLTKQLGLEVVINHQSTNTSALDSQFDLGDIQDTRLLTGLMFSQPINNWDVFGVFGIGFSYISWDVLFADPADSNRFSSSFGGGVKWKFNPRLGLRFETRFSYTDWPQEFITTNDLRWDFSGGLTIRLSD